LRSDQSPSTTFIGPVDEVTPEQILSFLNRLTDEEEEDDIMKWLDSL
jgi:hypothetical protein